MAQQIKVGADPIAQSNKVLPIALIAPLYLCMIPGTGGAYTSANLYQFLDSHPNQIIDIRGNHSRRNQILSIAQIVSTIREIFGLTMSEIAEIFGVTRQAAYAWLNGVEPKADVRTRILGLGQHVETLKQAGIVKASQWTRLPQSDGRSLIDLLKSGSDVSEAIASIRSSSAQLINQQPTKRTFGPPLKKKIVKLDEISVPISWDFGEHV